MANSLSLFLEYFYHLSNPNLIQLKEVIRTDNYVYLFMEYCESDLRKYLKKNKVSVY